MSAHQAGHCDAHHSILHAHRHVWIVVRLVLERMDIGECCRVRIKITDRSSSTWLLQCRVSDGDHSDSREQTVWVNREERPKRSTK